MSLWARILIGMVSLLFGISFLMTAIDPNGIIENDIIAYGMSAFCFVIATACFFEQSRPITLRLIGLIIFIASISYVINSFQSQNFPQAIICFLVWGIPSGYITIMGKYPSWGKATQVFNSKQNKRK